MTAAAKPKIYAALGKVRKDLGPIAKRRVDTGRGKGYNAFAVDDVYATLGPVFTKHGIIVVPRVTRTQFLEGENSNGTAYTDVRVSVEYEFYADDGSSVLMVFAGEGRDYGDKGTNKAVQQAFKYGLVQMFQISTGEIDPDAEHIDKGSTRKAKAPEPETSPADFEKAAKMAAFRFAQEDKDHAVTLYAAALEGVGVKAVATQKDYDGVAEWLAHHAVQTLLDAAPTDDKTEESK